NPEAPPRDHGQLTQRRSAPGRSVAHDRIRLFGFWWTPGGGYRRCALQRGYSRCVSVVRRREAVSVRLRTKLSSRRAEMFLGQSHDASTKSEERSTEPPLDLLRRAAPHERMDATGRRAARDISCHHKRNEKRRAPLARRSFGEGGGDAPYGDCVCSTTTGQAMGVTCNQQGSQTHSAAECAVQDGHRTGACDFCRPSRRNSIFP